MFSETDVLFLSSLITVSGENVLKTHFFKPYIFRLHLVVSSKIIFQYIRMLILV